MTPKRKARDRAFRILRLRGIWQTAKDLFNEQHASRIRTLVDDGLKYIGAEPEGARERKRREV